MFLHQKCFGFGFKKQTSKLEVGITAIVYLYSIMFYPLEVRI